KHLVRPSVESRMKILAFEFSSAQRSVAVVRATSGTEFPEVAEIVETGGLSTKPLAMVEEVLRQARLEREQIDCMAVGIGPGSYTGIRTGIALAQGWQLARHLKLLGISSAECLAAQAQAEGLTGRLMVIIDAQRQEFYLSVYEVSAVTYREIEPLKLAPL